MPKHTSTRFRKRLHVAILLAAAIIAACHTPKLSSHVAHNFFLGADVSALAAPTRRPLPAYKENNRPDAEWKIMQRHGWNAFRLRVFVPPVRNAPNNSLENTIPLAKKIKAAGGTLLLCIHLSDTWADPQHQEIPEAWRNLNFDQLEKQVETYCHNTIAQLKAAGAMPDWVQVGNEITKGTLWPLAELSKRGATPAEADTQWDHLTRILKAGIRGVKSASGETQPRIAIHIDKGGNWQVTQWFFDHIEAAHIDYDIIAESFYPPWRHGTLAQLRENMTQCAARYHKDFLVVETGYNRSHRPDNPDMQWPVTPQGRLQFMADLINTVKASPRGLGVMYWAPEWDLWNPDGTPAPALSVLDQLTTLANAPESHALK